MDERVMQFRVGVMFLATFILIGILLVMFGKLPKLIGHYYVEVRFESAPGVSKDTPVPITDVPVPPVFSKSPALLK